MNRRNFFKNLGAATVGVIVAPIVVTKVAENIPKPKREGYMNVDWKKVYPPLTITTVGDSTGGESPGAFIIINISDKHCDCPRIGFNLYHWGGDGMIHPLCIIEVALRIGYNCTARLVLKSLEPTYVIGKGAIKDGTVIKVGGSYFGDPKTTDPPGYYFEAIQPKIKL